MPTYTNRNDNRYFWTARQIGHDVFIRIHPTSSMRSKWKCSCGERGKYQADTFTRLDARQHVAPYIQESLRASVE